MIFSELYGAYYNAVAAILAAAAHPVTKEQMRKIIEEHAFSESVLTIEPALTCGQWQLLQADGTTPIRRAPTMPLTTLQRRWIKAISLDPRVALFGWDVSELADVTPLFTPEDICIFDRYANGDPFTDAAYQDIFRRILSSIHSRTPLHIEVSGHRNRRTSMDVMPEYLEYSEKDDKFRLITSGCRYGKVINVGRILSCETYLQNTPAFPRKAVPRAEKHVVLELYDERSALDRVLHHFAHFEKEAEQLGESRYRITLHYAANDETELVIRVLSFGPFIKVMDPPEFVEQIKSRLMMQKRCCLARGECTDK